MDNGNALSRKARRYYVFNTHSFHPNPVRVSFSAYPIEDQEILIERSYYSKEPPALYVVYSVKICEPFCRFDTPLPSLLFFV